jgi:hypothetical protein
MEDSPIGTMPSRCDR